MQAIARDCNRRGQAGAPPSVALLVLSLSSLALAAPAMRAAPPVPIPSWSAPRPDPSKPLAGFPKLAVSSTRVVFFGTAAQGSYNHGAMMQYADGVVTIAWKNGVGMEGEDAPGQRVKVIQTADGEAWTAPQLLFPSLSTSAQPVALFAGPFATLGGAAQRLYASATPAVIATGDAQGSQFCLWPDGLDPRNAGPPGQAQPVGTLLLRRVLPGLGNFGPVFWAADVVPRGFAPASAAAGLLTANETDAETQADVAELRATRQANGRVPCPDSATSGSLKCEACVNNCQVYEDLPRNASLANERTHWVVPEGAPHAGADILLYRCHAGLLYASTRPGPSGEWSDIVLSDIESDNTNLNASPLPGGRVMLVLNALPNAIRDPVVLAVSEDGLDFSAAGSVMSCTDLGVQNSTCGGRGAHDTPGPSYPQALSVVPPAPAGMQGVWVVATNNKQDVVVARLPFAALPARR